MKPLLQNSWIHRAVLVTAALFLLTVNLTQPFNTAGDVHAARIGNYAQNYIRYGYLNAQLGQIEQPFIQNPDQYLFNTFSPPLFPILISISYQLFGISEATTRILPIIGSTIVIVIIYQLGIFIKGKQLGFTAAAVAIATPIFQQYGRLVVAETLILPLTLLTIYQYFQWLKNGQRTQLIRIALLATSACLLGWSGYLTIPMIMIYTYLFHRLKLKKILPISIIPVTMFCLHLLHIYLLTGILMGYNLFIQVFSIYGYNPALVTTEKYTWLRFLITQIRKQFFLYTSAVLVLNLFWWGRAVRDWWVIDKLSKTQQQLLIFFLISMCIPLIFPSQLYVASYFNFISLPFFSLTSAIMLVQLIKLIKISTSMLYLTAICFAFGISYRGLVYLQNSTIHEKYQTAYLLAQFINNQTTNDQSIAIQVINPNQDFIDITNFYAKNQVTFTQFPVSALEDHQSEIKRNFDYAVTINTLPPEQEFKQYVDHHFTSTKHGIFTLYKIQ